MHFICWNCISCIPVQDFTKSCGRQRKTSNFIHIKQRNEYFEYKIKTIKWSLKDTFQKYYQRFQGINQLSTPFFTQNFFDVRPPDLKEPLYIGKCFLFKERWLNLGWDYRQAPRMDEKSDLKLLLRLQYARFLTNVHRTFVLQSIQHLWKKSNLQMGKKTLR